MRARQSNLAPPCDSGSLAGFARRLFLERAEARLLGSRSGGAWEAIFHRRYGCKNKWCLYRDLGSEKTVIKQELRSLSSPLLFGYRRKNPSKPVLLGPCEFCSQPGQMELNGGMEWLFFFFTSPPPSPPS